MYNLPDLFGIYIRQTGFLSLIFTVQTVQTTLHSISFNGRYPTQKSLKGLQLEVNLVSHVQVSKPCSLQVLENVHSEQNSGKKNVCTSKTFRTQLSHMLNNKLFFVACRTSSTIRTMYPHRSFDADYIYRSMTAYAEDRPQSYSYEHTKKRRNI